MKLEVEQKYAVADHEQIAAKLSALGCQFREPLQQADLYFAHPARDFAQTDEALRLRRSGDETCITYKGPKLDPTTKTRHEIELPIEGERGFEQYRQLLEVLGFRTVFEVLKVRIPGTIAWDNAEIEIALDEVAGLGSYIELELLSEPEGLTTAQEKLASLAARLGLEKAERRGYLDLLFQKQKHTLQK